MQFRWILPAFFVLSAAAQPSDLSLTLATKDGRTQFHQGEAIELQLQVQSSVAGKYAVWTLDFSRSAACERFTVEPAAGTVDPLADTPSMLGGACGVRAVYVGPPYAPPLLNGPIPIDLFLNEWISFRQPGRYRVTAESDRVAGHTLRSNAFEIEIAPFDAAWAAAQLNQALAHPDLETSVRTLRFLETPEAARSMVSLVGQPGKGASQLWAGLIATPYRAEAVAALYELVDSPDQPVFHAEYDLLRTFAALANLGPMAAPRSTESPEMHRWVSEVSQPYRQRAQPFEDVVTVRVVAALTKKQGEALAITLGTLGASGIEAPSPAVRKALLANLPFMPPEMQMQWLTVNWPRIASPEAAPILQPIAAGATSSRDSALQRLLEVAPESARPIALERIRRGDLSPNRALLELPDATLPELDNALASHFERGVAGADLLLARYATAAVAPRIAASTNSRHLCNGAIMAYFFRVDPANRRTRLSRIPTCSFADLEGNADLLMSPALEKQLIEGLSKRPAEAQTIAEILENAGAEASREPLLKFSSAPEVLKSNAFIPTPRQFNQALAACQNEDCRRQVELIRHQLGEPVTLEPDGDFVTVGPFRLRTAAQLRAKIAQFPAGTSFYLMHPFRGTWWEAERTRELSQILESAGMKLANGRHPPAPQSPQLR